MFNDENTAVVTAPVSEQSADAQAQAAEPNSLEEFMADETAVDVQQEQEVTEPSTDTTEPQTEEVPKGIKGRILKAEQKADKQGYERAMAEWAKKEADYKARIAEYEAKEMEASLEQEAKELSKAEHISVEFAKRVLRAERGMTAPAQISEKVEPSKTNDAPVLSDERLTQLNSQKAQIKERYNIDVMDLVTEEDAKEITEGRMELWDVAMRAGQKPSAPVRSTPAPVRSGNGSAPTGSMDFSTMSDEEFDKFNAKIDSGAVYKPRR